MTAMRAVEIVGVYAGSLDGAVVLLGESQTPERVLPIVIGAPEAMAIAAALSGTEPIRPQTHDLMAALLRRSDMHLDEVAITELRDGIFFAELFLETMTGLHTESARPSDAIALALRLGSPIVAAADLLDEAAVPVRRVGDDSFTDEEIDEIVSDFRTYLATATPHDFEPDDD